MIVYIDDILVSGHSEEEHRELLRRVLNRLEEVGIRLKLSKCSFMVDSVEYFGYKLDARGIHPAADKVKAVQGAPEPKDISQLKSYLGLLTYYARFLPNLAMILVPLYKLLRPGVKRTWTMTEQRAFQNSEKLLLSSQVLVHYDPSLEVILACDASSYGVGAVLSHRMADGSERPVAFASRTLSRAEQRYSQIEKEGLACVFGVKRFHLYMYMQGRRFTLITEVFDPAHRIKHFLTGVRETSKRNTHISRV